MIEVVRTKVKKETLIIYSSKNVKGRKDATGAFIPEAKQFAKVNNVPESNMLGVPCVGMKADKRREMVFDFIDANSNKNVEMIAWFGHGWSTGIQFGFTNKNLDELILAMGSTNFPDYMKQVLYACSTASKSENTRNIKMPGTEGGFADLLRDQMVADLYENGWVDGHLQPGHTTKNPYVIRFETDPLDTVDGEYIIDPTDELWGKWVKALKTDFRFQFPYLTEDEIRKRLIS